MYQQQVNHLSPGIIFKFFDQKIAAFSKTIPVFMTMMKKLLSRPFLFKTLILVWSSMWTVLCTDPSASSMNMSLTKHWEISDNEKETGRPVSQQLHGGISALLSGGEMLRLALILNSDSSDDRQNNNVSKQCMEDMREVFDGFAKRELWALRMIDANGKPPPGIMDGNIYWIGSFDECIRVTTYQGRGSQRTVRRNPSISGQYCTGSLKLLNWTESGEPLILPALEDFILDGVNVGLCTPDTCSEEDLRYLLGDVLEFLADNYGLAGLTKHGVQVKCKSEEQRLDLRAIVVLAVLAIYGVLILCSTFYDIFMTKQWKYPEKISVQNDDEIDDTEIAGNGNGNLSEVPLVSGERMFQRPQERDPDILMCFSIYTNTRKILKSKQKTGPLDALHGIKFLSMTWVILGHSYVFSMLISSDLLLASPIFFERFTAQVIVNALLSVDTFFAVSGILLSYHTMTEMAKRRGRLNWFFFYMHRIWRLSPPYFFVMVIHISLFKYLNNGALWPEDGIEVNYCKDSWWYNVLFINNFLPELDKQCMMWSWYLANDVQFFVLSPAVLVPLYRYRRIGLGLTIILLLSTAVISGLISKTYNLTMSIFLVDETNMKKNFELYFMMYYIKPYCRIGPFLCGILTGYVLYKTKCSYRLSKTLNMCCWGLSTVSAILVLYGTFGAMNGYYVSTDTIALYNATHKIVWGAAICWMVFACATGNGGFINTFLSWKAMVPLSRLSYVVYLVHPIVMWERNLSRRNLLYNTDQESVYLFLANLVVSYMVGFVLSVTVESPILSLEKTLLRRHRRRSEKWKKSII